MNRFLWALLLFSYCAIQAQSIHVAMLPASKKSILPQDFFTNDKDVLYNIRIEIADFIKNLKESALKVPSVLNELSSLAQELINTMVKIEQNDTENVMPSLLNIKEKIPVYQESLKNLKIPVRMNIKTQEGIKHIHTLTQKVLNSIVQHDFSKKHS
ncbi:hypothetical protein K9K77_02070 [Candidatus Babeliales bacterium]|nr:hypothetical protein [Candidatus Babeliales bacterium]